MSFKLRRMVEMRLSASDVADLLTAQLCDQFGLFANLRVVTVERDSGDFRLTLLPPEKPQTKGPAS
jgi:hypothetical protein